MLKRKATPINTEAITISHLRSLDNRQYKYMIESVEKYREGDKLLERSNKPVGDDKLIDDTVNFIETEGK